MSNVTVHIKNMAGEMTTLEVPQGTKVEDLPNHLYEFDQHLFPYFRTTVMRMLQEEETKETVNTDLADGDVLVSFVSDSVTVETSDSPDTNGWINRLVFPIDGRSTLYLYPRSMFHRGCRLIKPAVELVTSTFTRFGDNTLFLSRTLRYVVPTITIPQLKAIYAIVTQYYHMLDPQNKEHYTLEWAPEDPYECPCGSVIKGSSTASHIKTKKHQAYLESLKQ